MRRHLHGHPHREHAHPHGPVHDLRCYVRARLHRRLFLWFGIAIIATGATVAATLHAFGTGTSWRGEVSRARQFARTQFARAWDDPRALGQLVDEYSNALDVGVVLRESDGRVRIASRMPAQCRHPFWMPVERDGAVLGQLDLCMDAHGRNHSRWGLVAALGAVALVLWGMSHKVARRIAKPLAELTRVAQEIGEGRLASRAQLRHGTPGEVGDLTLAVNDMASRIERQLRDQRELLAAVSHEIRTPLTRIRLLLELARDGGRNALDEIDTEVVEIDALVGDLLASARMDFSTIAPQDLAVRDVATRALERASLPSTALLMEDGDLYVRADPTLLSRALAALLDNARKHGGGANVQLKVSATVGNITFAVLDRGTGFAPGDEERAFQPFYRAEGRAQQEPSGVGLGLALVRRIAESHGGRAYARNRDDGSGAVVALELPRASVSLV